MYPDRLYQFCLLMDLKTLSLLQNDFPFKGGNPAAGSPTATLLRLHPSHQH